MPGELPTELKTQVQTSNVSPGQANAPSNTQARLQAALWMLCNILIKVSEVLNKARNESNLASIKAGFSSADETAKAGLLQLGGGAILAGTGATQGVSGCKSATELAEVKEWRDAEIAKINENTMIEESGVTEPKSNLSAGNVEDSNITVQVEALEEEPSSAALDEIEEEIFYDAEEEVQSCKKTEPEEQTEEARMVEQANAQGKMTHREADKLIRRIDKEYDVEAARIQAKAGKVQGLGVLGQGFYHVSQGLGDVKRSQSQKETINEQTQNKTLEQIEKTTDGLNREIDKLSNVDSFKANSGVIKG